VSGDLAEVTRRLNADAERLAAELFPAGYRDGHDWRIGSLAGERGQSLAIQIAGPKRGRWKDFAAGAGGDMLDLVAQTRFAGDLGRALAWARNYLGVCRETYRREPVRAPVHEPIRAPVHEPSERAMAIWHFSQALQRGDPVWRYLEGRGIDLSLLPKLPGALRYHRRLYHRGGEYWPAMVGVITDAEGRNVAVHRTWLELRDLACEAAPRVVKAPLDHDAKMTLGRYTGGCIRLGRGASRRPWRDMPQGETLMLGEGIEDTLAAMTWQPQLRAAAGVSLSAMLSLELPDRITRVILLRQNDARGSSADKLAIRIMDKWVREGRRVTEWIPPVWVKDAAEFAERQLMMRGDKDA